MRHEIRDIEIVTCTSGHPPFIYLKYLGTENGEFPALDEEMVRTLHYMLGWVIAEFEAKK